MEMIRCREESHDASGEMREAIPYTENAESINSEQSQQYGVHNGCATYLDSFRN